MAGKKGPHFTELEKCTLIDLVGSKKDIIENKATDSKMIHKKNLEWENLTNEFNSRNGVNIRTCNQLKSLWKNLKSRSKSAVAKERRERSKTGGGVVEGTIDKLSSAVREIIPQQINSCQNAFDDDAELHGDVDNFNESPGSTSACNQQPPEKNPDVSVSEPQAPMSPVTVSTQTMTTSKSTTASKRKCVEQEDVKKKMLEMAEEEHQLKMEILHLKKQYIEAKIRKLEEVSSNKDGNNNTNHNQNNDNTCAQIWQPFNF